MKDEWDLGKDEQDMEIRKCREEPLRWQEQHKQRHRDESLAKGTDLHKSIQQTGLGCMFMGVIHTKCILFVCWGNTGVNRVRLAILQR